MRVQAVLLSSLFLAGCSEADAPPEQQAAADQAIEPEAIRYPDIEKHQIYGAACAFVPDGGGLGAIAIAMADFGYMKFDGEVVRFDPIKATPSLPLGGREQYISEDYGFALELDQGEGEQSGYETRNFPAVLTVTVSDGSVGYQARGLAQCGV